MRGDVIAGVVDIFVENNDVLHEESGDQKGGYEAA